MDTGLGTSKQRAQSRPVWIVAMAALLLAACSGDDGGADEGAETSGENGEQGSDQGPFSVQVAHTSSLDPGEVGGYTGPLEFGAEFDLAIEESDVQVFDSHSTAVQVVLSGGADVVGGSFLSNLQVIESGESLRVFCPYSSGFDSRLVGVGDVTSLEQITDPDTRVAAESPGGPVNFFTDLVLRARGIDINTTELTNVSVIEDSPLRVAALANGDVDVALINAFQVPQLEEQIGAENVHILSNVMEDVGSGGIFLGFAATEDYLDNNLDAATAFCASILQANRSLAGDFDRYVELSDKYMEPDVEEEILRDTWESIVDATLWPYNHGLTEDGVQQVVDVAMETGLLDEPLSYDQIVDTRPIDGALELLGGEVDPETIQGEASE